MNDREWSDVARGSSNQFAGFLVGLAVGAGIALLMAPASGSDTRRRLGATAKRLGEDAQEGLGHARDKMHDIAGEAKSAVDKGLGHAREKMHDIADEAKSAVDSGRKAFQRVRDGADTAATEFGDTTTGSRPSRV